MNNHFFIPRHTTLNFPALQSWLRVNLIRFTIGLVVLGGAVGVFLGSGRAASARSFFQGNMPNSPNAPNAPTTPNTAPTISAIADLALSEDGASGPINFQIGDDETTADQLAVTVASGNVTLVPPGGIVLGGISNTRTISITPAANQFGSAVISVTVSDGMSETVRAFTATVAAVNDAPTISTIPNQATNEDQATGPIAFQVSDIDSPALTVSAASSNVALLPVSNIGLGGSDGNRTVILTPTANQSGAVAITLTVSDGAATASTSFTLTVNPVNDAPTISSITNRTTNEDQPTSPIAFQVNDIDSTPLTVTAATNNSTLLPVNRITLAGTGTNRTVQLNPAANQSGVVMVTLTVSDGVATASTAFTLTVNPVNDAPTITSDLDLFESTPEDTPFGPFSVTVQDVDSAVLTVTGETANENRVATENIVVTPASGGNGTRTVLITPTANANGSVQITLRVSDGAASNTTSFVLTISAVNDPPTISAIAPQTLTEGTTSNPIPFTVGDLETNVNSLVVTADASNPDLIDTLTVNGSGANRSLTISPAPHLNGQAMVTVTVRDGGNLTASRSFLVTVAGVDDPPTIAAIANQSIDEDEVMGPINVVISDVDTPIGTLISSITATSSNTALVVPGGISFSGNTGTQALTIRPQPNATGSTTIQVRVSDGTTTATRNFNLSVAPVNDAPRIDPVVSPVLGLGIDEDTSFVVSIHVSDIDNTNLSVSAASSNDALVSDGGVVVNPANGTSTTRQLTVTPLPNANGTTVITLTVSDGQLTDATSFTLKVNPVNDAPTIVPLSAQTIAEDGATGPIPFTINDIDTPAGNVQVTVSSSNPALVPLSRIQLGGSGNNRTIALTPLPDANGVSQITLTASDGINSTSTTFTLQVTPVNDAPDISVIGSREVMLGGAAVFTFTVTDIDDPYTSLQVSGDSSQPAVVPTSGGQFQFAPIMPPNHLTGMTTTLTLVPNQVLGSSKITVHVSDGKAEGTSSFTVFVVNESNPPTIAPIANQTIDENTTLGPVLITVGDDRVPSGELHVSAFSSNPTLVANNDIRIVNNGGITRTLWITPTADQSGVALITVLVNDGINATSTSFNLTVNAVDAPPTIALVDAQPITVALVAGAASASVPFHVGDADTDLNQLQITASSSNPTVVPASNIMLSGTGANRTLRITPVSGQAGQVVITLRVSDGTTSAVTSFTINVIARIAMPALLNNFSSCNAAQTDCSEPNNTLQTAAGPINLFAPYTGTVNNSGDPYDFYGVALEGGALYTITLTFGVNDLDLYLYGPAPQYSGVASSNFQGTGPEQIVFRAPATGVYFILVYGYQTASQPQRYTLTAVR